MLRKEFPQKSLSAELLMDTGATAHLRSVIAPNSSNSCNRSPVLSNSIKSTNNSTIHHDP